MLQVVRDVEVAGVEVPGMRARIGSGGPTSTSGEAVSRIRRNHTPSPQIVVDIGDLLVDLEAGIPRHQSRDEAGAIGDVQNR
jgi:hypothetical protein